MPRWLTVMVLVAGLMVTAMLRVHHCGGVVGPCCSDRACATLAVSKAGGPRVHTVLSDRSPGSVGACATHCGDGASQCDDEPRDDLACDHDGGTDCDRVPTVPAPSHDHAPDHSHLGCSDATQLAQATGKGSLVAMPPALAPIERAFASLMLLARGVAPPIEARSGDPPPGLRTTRIQV